MRVAKPLPAAALSLSAGTRAEPPGLLVAVNLRLPDLSFLTSQSHLIRELVQINVVSNYEVPAKVVDEEVLANDVSLSGVARADNAHDGTPLG